MSRIIVTLVVVAVLVGAVLGMAGVLHFRNSEDNATIKIDKKELREKTDHAVQKTEEVGGQILDKAGKLLHDAAKDLRKARPTSTRHAVARCPQQPTAGRQPKSGEEPVNGVFCPLFTRPRPLEEVCYANRNVYHCGARTSARRHYSRSRKNRLQIPRPHRTWPWRRISPSSLRCDDTCTARPRAGAIAITMGIRALTPIGPMPIGTARALLRVLSRPVPGLRISVLDRAGLHLRRPARLG